MKFYADIILSGENFNPFYVTEQYHINFSKALNIVVYNKRLKRHEKNGYAVLSSIELDSIEKVINSILSEYEILLKIGEEKLGIEYKEFNLYIECLQNSFTIDTLSLARIKDYFTKINITYIQEE